jgi:hypothetical protein
MYAIAYHRRRSGTLHLWGKTFQFPPSEAYITELMKNASFDSERWWIIYFDDPRLT